MKRIRLKIVVTIVLALLSVVLSLGGAIGELYATVGARAIQHDRRFHVDDWFFMTYETWGGESVSVRYGAENGPRDRITEARHRNLPNWTRLQTIAPVPADVDVNAMEYAFGWPFRWMCYGFRMDSQPETYEEIRTLSLDAMSLDESQDDGSFVHVRWLDLAASIALWMIVWIVVFFPWSAARTVARVRRHRCIDCGYDLRATTVDRCSECGSEISRSRHLTRKHLLTLTIIILVCGALTAVPSIRDAVRANAKSDAWARGAAWLDDIIAGRARTWDEEEGLELITQIRDIDGHAEQIALRISEVSAGDEITAIAHLVNDLARVHPDDQYLPLIDALIVRCTDLRVPGLPVLGYMSYPFPKVAKQVISILETSENPDLLNASMTVVRLQQDTALRKPHGRRIEDALRRCLMLEDHPRIRLRSLSALLSYGFMDEEHAKTKLDRLLQRHPALKEDPIAVDLGKQFSEVSDGLHLDVDSCDG